MTLWEPKFNNHAGMTLTCCSTVASPLLPHTVVCDSMDHWFAPVKRRGELGLSWLLRCSTSHAIITVHQSSMMLKCLSSVDQRSPNKALLQTRYAGFIPRQHLISRAGFDKSYYQVFWMLSHAVALSDHWCSGADTPSPAWWMSEMRFDQLWFPRLVWTRDLEGL